MKDVVRDWAAQGLRPKRIWNALLERFGLDETTAPPLSKVQRFAHQHVAGRLGGSDLRSAVLRKVQEAGFRGGEEETAAFTFTSRTDENGNYKTGNRSDADPFVVGISSKKLLRRADRDPESFVFHMDATYKLTQVGYPVIVVGISDKARRFHLLAIFMVSQQQEGQHTEVLLLLRNMFTTVTGRPLRVKYVMGDADAAQWNAVNCVFGSDRDYTFLMCYFHVAKKIFEKTRSLTPARATEVMEDIHDLHFSEDEAAFHSKLAKIQARWNLSTELAQFSTYFSKVWLNHRFWRWQCFHTPQGFATTNNPCETYNAAIKRDVTLRRKLKVGSLIPQLLTLCRIEGVTARSFATACEPDAKLVRRVKAMMRANLLSMNTTSRCSIAFLLSDAPAQQADVVNVVSRPSPRVFDETRRRTVEDLPVSSQLSKLTANMEIRGMPAKGWPVDISVRVCPCKYCFKYGSSIHLLYAMETQGTMDIMGRETLVNRTPARQIGSRRGGRPRNVGQGLERE